MGKFEQDYWNARYKNGGNSGYGSYDDQLTFKLNWLKQLPIKSISEIGCGDLNFAEHLMKEYKDVPVTYFGQDISDVIIERNKKKYSEQSFTTNLDEVPPADLVLCIDVLFHIIEDADVEPILKKLESIWTKYLAITAYEYDQEMDHHVRIRKFDYKRFGEPILRKVVEEDGDMYFYIFKK